MASKYWIKLYLEILDDPKMGMLPDNLWRRVIELFLLAGQLSDEMDEPGTLPTTKEIAWILRQSEVILEEEIGQLADIGILTRLDSGWLVTNFAKRQAPVEAADRMREMRKRQRKDNPNPSPKGNNSGYANVTKRNAESDTESESINQKEKARHPDFGKVCEVYQYEIGGMSQTVSDALDDDIKTYGASWVIDAMKRAAKANARNLNYVEAILKRWKSIGGPQNDKPRKLYSKDGATNGTYQRHSNGTKFETGEHLDNEPTFDPYTGREIPAGGA